MELKELEKIRTLTKVKNKQFTITLNEDLISLYKKACEKNNTNITHAVENHMLVYISNSGLLTK